MTSKNQGVFLDPFIQGILGLVLLNLLLFGDVLFFNHGRVLSSPQTDLFLHFAAWRQFAFDQLRQGHLALWNPHYLCGTPFLGNFESALLYPPNWLYMVLPLALAINYGIVAHIFLAGLFTYLWTHHRGLHPLACFVGGTIYMLGGFYFLHLFAGHLPNLCAMTWAPLVFLSIDGFMEKKPTGWILLGVFAVSMQILSGHPQYVYFTAIIAGIYFLLNLSNKNKKMELAAFFAAVYLGAFFISAIQLWTGLQAFSECGRSIPQEFHSTSSFSFPPQNLLTIILPDFFGNLSSSPYWSQWFLWEESLFIGMTAFFLVLLSLGSPDPKARKWALTSGVFAFVMSLGSFTPLYRLFYDYLPWFKGFRGTSKFDYIVGLLLAMLAAIGMDYLVKNKIVPRWIVFLTLLTGLILGGLELSILESLKAGMEGRWAKWFSSIHWLEKSISEMDPIQREKFILTAGVQSALSLFWGTVICFFLSIFFYFRKQLPAFAYAVAALSVLELFIYARENRPTFDLSKLNNKFDQIQKTYQRDPGDYRVYGTGSASLVTGVDDIWEDEPMVLGRYGRFVCYSQGLSEKQLFSVLPIYKRFHPVFGMMRLKYRVFMDRDPVQFEPMPFKTLPRMLLLNQWESFADNSQILPALFSPSFNPDEKVFLEKTPDPLPAAGKVKGSVKWKDLSTDLIEISAEVPQSSLLLVTDNFSEGWRGVALPGSVQSSYEVMPANYFLRAIPLSQGKHHLVLEYRPNAFIAGKWSSILSCLIYIGILTSYFRKHFQHPRR